MNYLLLSCIACLVFNSAKSQIISITNLGTTYSQNFNSLDTNTTASTNMPNGWSILENGGTATTSYRSGTGSSNTGDTYSFGAAGGTDRSLGSVASGTVQSRFGALFVNKSNATITSVSISLTMEQWRFGGARTSADSMYFSYGTNNGSLATGNWNTVSSLTMISKILGGATTGGALNGNDTANQNLYSYTITGLTIAANDTLYIRWVDPNVTGSDDGLSIDDFSFVAYGSSTPVGPASVSSLNSSNITTNSLKLTWTKPSTYIDSTMQTLVFIKQGSAITQGTPTYIASTYLANTNFTGNGTKYQNDTNAKCVLNSDSNNVSISGLNPSTNYYVLVYVVRKSDTAYSASVTQSVSTLTSGPIGVSSILFIAAQTNAIIKWTQDTSYKKNLHTTLLYLKQASSITSGTPTKNPLLINSNPVFLNGSKYQNDTNAYCMYKGDTNFVSVSGLTAGTSYYILAYVVSDVDSNYSNPTSGNGTTYSVASSPVSAITFTGTSTTAATIAWTKPTEYTNSSFTTLVFVKQASAITAGTPTKTVSYYTASPYVSLGFGTKYQNDTSARCVYKGDTNFVNISFITNSAPYYVLVYIVHDADSVYSTSATGTGSALPPPPPPPYFNIGQINTTNATTGNPDSLNVRVGLRGIAYGINRSQTGGTQFLMRDNTGGITVSNTSTFGYGVVEGDSIMVAGSVSTTRGLVIVTTLDTIKLLGTGKPIKIPVPVLTMNEASENDLVILDSVKLLPTTDTTWKVNGTYNVITKTHDTVGVKIYTNTLIAGTTIPPTHKLTIIGMGGQSSPSLTAPFAFKGYYIIPRKSADIISVDTPSHAGINEVNTVTYFNVYPNPVNDNLAIHFISKINTTATIEVVDLVGKMLYTTSQKINVNENAIYINTANLNSGIYFVRMNMNGEILTRKIIKQ